ncbi:hypothetical protein BJY52DRAFT_1230190 [Lactarius psammicola]|nr:hypothetical protein BJY52DRAFT_1230190 [Lactarius psammicola]
MAYDNFDINFKTSEPTIAHCSSFVSATSATAIPLVGVENVDVLHCSAALWSVDPCNSSPSATPISFNEFDLLKFHVLDTYDRCAPDKEFSPWQEAFAWHIREILINHGQYFAHLSGQLGALESVFMIPLTKTEQIPMKSMKIKQSLVDGNIKGGLGDPTDPGFDTSGDVDISEFVLLIHGDLLTKEHLNTVRDSWQIEDTPRDRFQYVVFVPGLFHYKMACVNALWRTYLQSKEGRKDINSTFQHAGILQPQETGILTTKPGFHRMHDVVHHELWAAILKCWRTEASSRSALTSLKDFAASKPEWDLIVEISRDIVWKYVATSSGLSQLWARPEADRDQQYESQCLHNRDYLLYANLCNTLNSSDIGHAEASFLPWIYMFCGTGKHKYASQLARFENNLYTKHPALPKGGWEGTLLMREHATKVVHKGVLLDGSLRRLHAYMQSSGLCEFHCGRTVEREITDCIVKGLQVVHAKKIVLPVKEEAHGIEAADLEAH